MPEKFRFGTFSVLSVSFHLFKVFLYAYVVTHDFNPYKASKSIISQSQLHTSHLCTRLYNMTLETFKLNQFTLFTHKLWPIALPFVSGGWGPQTGSVYSQFPQCCHHSERKAGSSCRRHWWEVGMEWRALIGHWCPNSSSHWWSCYSWPTGFPSSP